MQILNEEYKAKNNAVTRFAGEEATLKHLIGEMAELTQAIIKYERLLNADATLSPACGYVSCLADITEELADVLVCIDRVLYSHGHIQVENFMQYKIDRTIDRIRKNGGDI